jgi:hypothetical protein
MAQGEGEGKLVSEPNYPMQTNKFETRITQARAKRSRYRVVNHQEAGLFDSMTGATLWALKNVRDWDWSIEPVAGALLQ